jgi:hypothetical protein
MHTIHFRHITRFLSASAGQIAFTMSVITAPHSSIQLILGMLMGSVPPSGLIKLPSWEGSQFQGQAQSHLQSINALSFAVAWTSASPNNSRLRDIRTHKNYTLRERFTGEGGILWCGGGWGQWLLILY